LNWLSEDSNPKSLLPARDADEAHPVNEAIKELQWLPQRNALANPVHHFFLSFPLLAGKSASLLPFFPCTRCEKCKAHGASK